MVTADSTRIQTVPFATQDYVSVQHGDERIDMYVTEPAAAVHIPVRGGAFEVSYPEAGPTLSWIPGPPS